MSACRRHFNRHSLHPWADLPGLGEDDSTPVIVSGDGIYITDDQGRRMIDGPAGMWCMQTGYGRREIADAVADQIMHLGYSTAFSTINPREVELARRIAGETPGDLNRVFFTTGGSTAVDSALRLCQLANNIKGERQRKHILSRHHAYHGSTFLSASVTGKERDKTAMDVLQDNVHFLSVPCHFYHHQELGEAAFCDFLVRELEDRILALGPDNVMCFIAEPVLGSGGVIVPPVDYNRRCWEVVKKYGIVYIADEVVTAFGRLGHWFASEKVFGLVPDIITFAKGLTSGYVPLGGFAVSDRFMDGISGDSAGGNIYSNGYTWSANPVSCAAALASWDIIEREGLLAHVREIGPYFQRQLRTLLDIPLVADVRGTGLMAAVEMRLGNGVNGDQLLQQDYAIGDLVDSYCREYGLLVRPLINVCIMSPPLIITTSQIDDMVRALRRALERADKELHSSKKIA
ncbi:MAG: aminotransferase [Halioglobus sp.]|nr:aminotransferase [Halioglobus sp.]MCB1709035.1 aminotransferase [Halioglobus sp.]MCP5121928.1 aminotransferase [Pseudomonadales bacterium]MCP5192533.1 aminotransferase [Pseudomonadales bacterium]